MKFLKKVCETFIVYDWKMKMDLQLQVQMIWKTKMKKLLG